MFVPIRLDVPSFPPGIPQPEIVRIAPAYPDLRKRLLRRDTVAEATGRRQGERPDGSSTDNREDTAKHSLRLSTLLHRSATSGIVRAMIRNRVSPHRWILNAVAPCVMLVLVFASACATRKPAEPKPLPPEQAQAFFRGARDPRQFWLTVYESDAGPVVTGGNRLHAERFAHMPFVSSRSSTLPLLEIRGRHPTEYAALLDTSSRGSWVDFDTARAVRATPIAPPLITKHAEHVADPNIGCLSVISTIRLENLRVESALFYVRMVDGPLGPLLRNVPTDRKKERKRAPAPLEASFVLGCDWIKSFAFVQIDYPNRSVAFSSTRSYTPSEDHVIAVLPLREKNGIFAFRGTIDTEPVIFLLDSVGDYELAMARPADTRARRVTVGDLVFRNTDVVPLDEHHLGLPDHPRIGRKLLEHYRVTFDRSQRLVFFERPK